MIFDTDVLIWFFRGNGRAAREIERAPERMISLVSVMELYQGSRSRQELRGIANFLQLSSFRVLPLNEPIGQIAAGLIEEHALGSGLQIPDALIAATALERRSALLTGNVKHFRQVPKLVLRPFRATAP